MNKTQEPVRLTTMCLLVVFLFCTALCAKQDVPVYYDIKDVGEPKDRTSMIWPWKVVSLDAEYGGQWMVAGDVDGDGRVEIVSSEKVFCNLSGGKISSDVLVKNRYHQIWAYDQAGNLLWTVKDPGGYRTAHQPRPVDIDGDGRDEIMAGYAMLNSDGSVRWVYKSKTVDQKRGHLDCVRVFQRGDRPEDFRLVLTCCGANNVALVDGTGGIIWEVAGHHFESVDVGKVFPGLSGQQIVVDIDHQPLGNSPVWTLDEKGKLLGRIVTDYSRHHCLLDWTGDGVDEILVAHNGCIYDHHGRRIGVLAVPGGDLVGERKGERSMLIGDVTSDGVSDVMMVSPEKVYIYVNRKGTKSSGPLRLGTEFNFTLY